MLNALHLIIAAGHAAIAWTVIGIRLNPHSSGNKGKHILSFYSRKISNLINTTGNKKKKNKVNSFTVVSSPVQPYLLNFHHLFPQLPISFIRGKKAEVLTTSKQSVLAEAFQSLVL